VPPNGPNGTRNILPGWVSFGWHRWVNFQWHATRGTFNPTIETLVKVALALNARVALHLHSRETAAHWFDVATASFSMTGQTSKSGIASSTQIDGTPLTKVEARSEVNGESTSAVAA